MTIPNHGIAGDTDWNVRQAVCRKETKHTDQVESI